MDDKLLERKEKIKLWFKDPYHLIILGVIVLALVVRLYFFFLTQNQPLWWDESEYMLKGKSMFLGTPSTGWAAQREIVIPIIWGLLYKFVQSEFLPRFLQIIVSLVTVFLTYVMGKEIYNKKIGIIASLIMSVNAIHLFFTVRLLIYHWPPLFFLLTFYCFWKGYVKKESKLLLYLTPFVAAVGASIYSSVAFAGIAIFLYLLITEHFKFLKKKEIWMIGLIAFVSLLPYFIYSQLTYGNPIARFTLLQATAHNLDFSYIFGYLNLSPHLFGGIFTIAVAIGFLYLIGYILFSYDLLHKEGDNSLKSHLIIILWSIVTLGFYTYVAMIQSVVYDAFVLCAFPALAIMGAKGFELLYKIPINKNIIIFILVGLLFIGSYNQLSYSNSLIEGKIDSYLQVKQAGLWIKDNTDTSDTIFSTSIPQITYYSERTTYSPNTVNNNNSIAINSSDELTIQFKEKNPKFFADSIFEGRGSFIQEFIDKNKEALTVVQVYFLDAQQKNPAFIIYSINSSKII